MHILFNFQHFQHNGSANLHGETNCAKKPPYLHDSTSLQTSGQPVGFCFITKNLLTYIDVGHITHHKLKYFAYQEYDTLALATKNNDHFSALSWGKSRFHCILGYYTTLHLGISSIGCDSKILFRMESFHQTLGFHC